MHSIFVLIAFLESSKDPQIEATKVVILWPQPGSAQNSLLTLLSEIIPGSLKRPNGVTQIKFRSALCKESALLTIL